MHNIDCLSSFRSAWLFNRKLTNDLLIELTVQDLLFIPGEGLGAFWKQFRHVGRVQECYIEALTTKSINFTPEGKSYDKGPQKKWLMAYLEKLDTGMMELLPDLDWDGQIDWYGEQVNIFEHMLRLVSHETLHHGQWITYMKLLKKDFPDSWAAWGV